VNRRDCDLTRGADDLLRADRAQRLAGRHQARDHREHDRDRTGMCERHGRRSRSCAASATRWCERRPPEPAARRRRRAPVPALERAAIFDKPRFQQLSQLYGYLAKQFTIFGQHVHIGCADGDSALYLLHALSRYVPHFIALSASSPYHQGVDTAFDSARLNSVFAFPLSGRAPVTLSAGTISSPTSRRCAHRVVESMKDFYWDIRPKPEYGTIEVRVFDTPLTVERAAALAAYVQALARWLLIERPVRAVDEDDYLVYTYNRFQACRFGLDGMMRGAGARLSRQDPAVPGDFGGALDHGARCAGVHGADAGGGGPTSGGRASRCATTSVRSTDWCCRAAPTSARDLRRAAARPEWSGDRVRDMYEVEMLWAFVFQQKPVLGICRGLQLINVAFNGTLYQDIPTELPARSGTSTRRSTTRCTTTWRFEPGSLLAGSTAGRAAARQQHPSPVHQATGQRPAGRGASRRKTA
jgi:carboxylate-amine ligase